MIKLCCNINQYEGEGLGSRIQCHISSKIICKHLGFKYLETEVKNLAHNYDDIDDYEFCKNYNNYFEIKQQEFNLPIVDIKPYTLEELKQVAVDENVIYRLYMASPKKILDSDINILESKKYFTKKRKKSKKINITIHLRVINKVDTDIIPIRNLYSQNNRTEHSIKNIISNIESKYGKDNVVFNIYTQTGYTDGSKTNAVNFDNLKNKNVILNLDSDITETIQACIESDIFIMSNSSLSYICYLMREGITFAYKNFWHILDKKVMRI
jgi:hypothetical protein